MINEKAYALGANRSCIRDLFEYGRARAAVVGAENVYDYSLGNPSIPAPDYVNQSIREVLAEMDPLAIHGYTTAVGDAGTRKAIADDLGVTLIPQLNIFGHATLARHGTGKHAALDLKPEYQPYFEPLAGWNWCLSNPKTKILHKALIKEMYEVFGCPPYFHIGCDEASAPSCPECVKSSYSTLFADYVKEISSYVKSLGAKSLMWHDMLLDKGEGKWEYAKGTKETASLLRELPRDIIICDWYYRKPLESYPSLDHFKALGFEVLTCPWDNNKGTLSLLSYAHKLGLKGVLGTLWHHNHGRWLLDIYFLVANRAWNSDSSLAVYGSIYNNHYAIHTHLRHIGWDMKNKNPRHAGVFYDELPPEPYQTW